MCSSQSRRQFRKSREHSAAAGSPARSEQTRDSTLNSQGLAGILEVTDLLPVGLHGLGSHGLILLSHNGSKGPLPAYWSQKRNEDTEHRV